MPDMRAWVDNLWHRRLGRPYRLAVAADDGPADGQPVVLLHGLGRSYVVWQYLLDLVAQQRTDPDGTASWRVLALDLLGFGASPKPAWLRYDADDHARAVIATLERRRLKRPVVLAGHSMGCLVAVRVARLRPDLVRHLILYEMPLYAGLPDKPRYRLRLNMYFALYKRIITYQPDFTSAKAPRAQRWSERIIGYRMDAETWPAFIKSLEHTIMEQTTHLDIKQLPMPMDVIYGTKDRVVIRGKTKELFGSDTVRITDHTVRESHGITHRGSQFILQRIAAALKEAKP